jgi:hypothetical protein
MPVLDQVLAAGNVRLVHHLGGALLSISAEKAATFAKPDADDDTVAAILGYPETKSSLVGAILADEDMCVVQVRGAANNVVVSLSSGLA